MRKRLSARGWLRLLNRSKYERDLEAEIQFHIESRAADLVAEGLTPADALQLARKEFGSQLLAKDYCRDGDRVQWFDELRRNLLFARRRFSRKPGLFTAIVVTLALCIAVNVVIFGVVDGVLWKSLPYPEAEALGLIQSSIEDREDERRDYLNGSTWQALEDGVSSLELAVLSVGSPKINFVAPAQDMGPPSAALVQMQRVGRRFFSVLGVPLARGRSFSVEEDSQGGPAVAVIAWSLWQDQFNGSEEVIGSAMTLAGEPHTVVGIAGEGFDSRVGASVWSPLRPSTQGEGGGSNYQVIARSRSGVSPIETQVELERVAQRIEAAGGPEGFSLRVAPLHSAESAWIRPQLLVMAGAVVLILLIGCVNIAGLLMATMDERMPEMATRRALGGGLGSVFRQLMTESVFLGACGAALGTLLAVFGLRWITDVSQSNIGLWQEFALDSRVLSMVVSVTLVATILFGLAPALVLARGAASAMRARGATMGKRRRGQALVVAQVALGVGLLLTAGLLLRTLLHLGGEDPGVDLEGIVTAQVSLRDARFESTENIARYFEAGLARLAELGEVEGAAVALSMPFERGLNFPLRFHSEDEVRVSAVNYVSPDALTLLGVPLVAGRALQASDTQGAPPVVLVNRSFVERYTDGSVLGKLVRFGGGSQPVVGSEIVGVVGNIRQRPSFSSNAPLDSDVPTVYLPIAQVSDGLVRSAHTWFMPSWIVKARGSMSVAGVEVRDTLNALDPMTPVASVRGLRDVRNQALSLERFQAFLLSIFAVLAVALAAVGVAGATAGGVADRKKEFGIRLALGSSLGSAVARAAMPSLAMVSLGVAVGLLLGQVGVRSVTHMLYGVTPQDLASHLVAGLGLLFVAGLACVVPAFRIVRMSVVSALQGDV